MIDKEDLKKIQIGDLVTFRDGRRKDDPLITLAVSGFTLSSRHGFTVCLKGASTALRPEQIVGVTKIEEKP